MRSAVRKTHPLLKLYNGALVDLPAPMNLSIWWNFGSLLGFCLLLQVITGLFLAMHYTPSVDMAFTSVVHIQRDVSYGWLMRGLHANGASMFFFCMYLHIGRGLYYGSYLNKATWNIGVLLMVLVMGTAFLGYVLPWGQMSFWGATVITNLLSSIPYVGKLVVEWVWGGFSVNNATLNRFFVLHFALPFAVMGMSAVHLLFLHETGSNNPMGINSDSCKVPFHCYYTVKDVVGFVLFMAILLILVLLYPNLLADPDNFVKANPMVTPTHIQPEWYFLFAYAILRSIPNKLGGVLALMASVAILLFVPLFHGKFRSLAFYPANQCLFWMFVGVFCILTWIGSCPVEMPYELLGKVYTLLYFSYFVFSPMVMYVWDTLLK